MCVFALLFGNVTFAMMTPKTIRGCVTYHPYVFLYQRMQWSRTLTVDLISSIKVFSLNLSAQLTTSCLGNRNLLDGLLYQVVCF